MTSATVSESRRRWRAARSTDAAYPRRERAPAGGSRPIPARWCGGTPTVRPGPPGTREGLWYFGERALLDDHTARRPRRCVDDQRDPVRPGHACRRRHHAASRLASRPCSGWRSSSARGRTSSRSRRSATRCARSPTSPSSSCTRASTTTASLSGTFLEQLGLPEPTYHLGVGSGTHAEQTAAVIVGVERVLRRAPPTPSSCAGDVNSTIGAALAAAKLGVPVAHLEAGPALRRLDDAGGDQPRRHRPPRRPAARATATTRSTTCAARACRTPHRARRQHHDRQPPAPAAGGPRHRRRRAARPAARRLRARDAAPAGAGRRPGPPRRRRWTCSATSPAQLPVVFPVHPRTRARLDDAGTRRRAAVRRCSSRSSTSTSSRSRPTRGWW